MCCRCDGFLERKRINTPYEYRDLVRQILETIEQGTLRLLSGTCPLEQVLTARPWASDLIVHMVECTTCSRRFRLRVEKLGVTTRCSPTTLSGYLLLSS